MIRNQQGFTLIEGIVAMAILTVALIPIYSLATLSLNVATSIKNNVTAANLAQEGVEVVRAIRDANWLNGDSFSTDLNGCTTGCRVQWKSNDVFSLSSNPVLTVHPTTGTYYYKDQEGNLGGVDTAFRRKITITPLSSKELKVESNITWSEKNASKSITLESHLFDWK